MTAPYRPAPCASCGALRAEVAALRAKPARVPMRWQIAWSEGSGGVFLLTLLAWATDALGFVVAGASASVLRGAAVCTVASLLWTLAFVRRVPADGGGR